MLSVCVKGDGGRFHYRASGMSRASQASRIPNFENWGALALAAWNGNTSDDALRLMGVAPQYDSTKKKVQFRVNADTGMMVYILYALCGLSQRQIAYMAGLSDISQRKALKAAGLYVQRDNHGRPIKKEYKETDTVMIEAHWRNVERFDGEKRSSRTYTYEKEVKKVAE